ncbi:MAG: lamin tail domain-containing protein [candidate division Zixibacteria bacterium]|nr:lamin tail domain-containing protein [candidate division Zixibacteria bacterium]
MTGWMKRLGVTLLSAAVMFPVGATSGVVVNEVMSNEPEAFRSLEWIELYVDSAGAAAMDDYEIIAGDDMITFPSGLVLNGGEFYIVCRRLVSAEGSLGFEGRWGDSSGIWGDSPEEAALPTPQEASFSLTNTGGVVELYRRGVKISELSWDAEGSDGVSWERVSPQSELILQSVDPDGSTPGIINSHTPVEHDLALEGVAAQSHQGLTSLTFMVLNRGLAVIAGAELSVYTADPLSLLDVLPLPEMEPGDTAMPLGSYLLEGRYCDINAVLSDDDRTRDNSLHFTAPGAGFPPLILTEILANPQPGSCAEWIEIKSRAFDNFDLKGWRIGDSRRLHSITDTSIVVEPGERLVLSADGANFENYCGDVFARVVVPTGWAELNNLTADTARLVDQFGWEADRFEYTLVFDSNYTWSRLEEGSQENTWGRSESAGGTPGEQNRAISLQADRTLNIEITPAVFSPDGDGIEDTTVISIAAPDVAGLQLRIYDRQGRVVREFDIGVYHRNSYVWYGRSDAGNRLPIGVYIVYCEALGGGSAKKPVVIAR